jgi:NAD(P)-dependent dehydrogenase (short-subunit alcohol dehydrogenase family)
MLRGKNIIVTGAGSGIGRKSAEAFARAGAQVVVVDLNEAAAADTAASIRSANGSAVAYRCNVAVEDEVAAMVAFTVAHYGRLDGAFNNAGIEMHNKPVHELTAADWRAVIDVDLTGVFFCIKHEFLAMKGQGRGSIVNAASTSGLRGHVNSSEYVAAKHGVVGLSKAAAIDGGSLGIRVNAVCPGLILTPMVQDRLMSDPVFSQALEDLRKRHIIGRFGETDEVANAVMWLLSDLSSFTTGTAMIVDGGYAI